jgi:uncharacterized membrane protein SirB2
MDYTLLKTTHVACAVLSYALFFVRGVWMMRGSSLLARRWVRIAPHVIDTVLLASAIAMLIVLALNPFTVPWIAAKIAGLIVYIGLGIVALRHGRTRGARIAAWIAAQAVFFYIVAAAVTKHALPLIG